MIYWTPGRILIGVLMVVAVFGVPSYCLRVTVTPTYTPTTPFTSTYSTPATQSTPILSADDLKILDKVRAKAQKDYPNDYSTQKYVFERETESYQYMKTIPTSKLKSKIERDYPLDFSTQKYVYEKETEAKEYMQSLATPAPTAAATPTVAATPVVDRTTEIYNLLGNKTFDSVNGVTEDAENIKAIKDLIKRGTNINGREPQTNSTLLIAAAAFNRPQAVYLILENGADTNAQNKNGQTALMYAAMHNNLKIARLLIAAGANRNIADNSGTTALAFLNLKYGNEPSANSLRQLLESPR